MPINRSPRENLRANRHTFSRRSLLAHLAAGGAVVLVAANARANGQDDLICRGMRAGQTAQLISDADLDLMEKLGLLEGHLMIGMALLQAKMAREALPHFGHPVRELYDYLKPQLQARNIASFEADLTALEAEAKKGLAGTATDSGFAGVVAKLNALRATVPAAKRQSPRFLAETLALLMEDVAGDYGEAIDKGRIANIVEYHDAMGFLRYVEQTLVARRAGADAKLLALLAKIDEQVVRAKAAFPALQPPTRPPVSVGTLRGCAERVAELAKTA